MPINRRGREVILQYGAAEYRMLLFNAIDALEALVERCDGEAGVRADGSNIDTQHAHAALDAMHAWEESALGGVQVYERT